MTTASHARILGIVENRGKGRTGMDNVHGSHCAASIVKDPFLVQVDVPAGQLLAQLRHDKANHGTRVVAVSSDGTQAQVMEIFRVEDVEPLQMGIEVIEDCGQDGQHDGEDSEGGGPRPWRRTRIRRHCSAGK